MPLVRGFSQSATDFIETGYGTIRLLSIKVFWEANGVWPGADNHKLNNGRLLCFAIADRRTVAASCQVGFPLTTSHELSIRGDGDGVRRSLGLSETRPCGGELWPQPGQSVVD